MQDETRIISLVMERAPERGKPWVTRGIFAICVAVWLGWAATGPPNSIEHPLVAFGLTSQAHLLAGLWPSLLSAAFSHFELWHLAVNMMVLFSFAPTLEHELGRGRFAVFYLVAAVISSGIGIVIPFVLGLAPHSMLGASGALSAVLALFVWRHPKVKLLVMFVIPMPAIVGVAALVIFDIGGLVAQVGGGGLPIAHGAHLGGVAFGLIAAAGGLGAFKPEGVPTVQLIERQIEVAASDAARFESLRMQMRSGKSMSELTPKDNAFLDELMRRTPIAEIPIDQE